MKILKVTNLIPVKVDYELNGDRKSVFGYIDYESQMLSGFEEVWNNRPVDSSRDDIIHEFTESVKSFLNQLELEFEIPAEVYKEHEKGKSFNINDFMTEELSVQLKENCKGKQNGES